MSSCAILDKEIASYMTAMDLARVELDMMVDQSDEIGVSA